MLQGLATTGTVASGNGRFGEPHSMGETSGFGRERRFPAELPVVSGYDSRVDPLRTLATGGFAAQSRDRPN